MNYRVPAETVRLDLQPGVVFGRRIDLDIIFRNLIDNAVKYAGAPPRVEVSLHRRADGKVLVRIADNGRGIPPHLRRKIFGRFVRLGWNWSGRSPAPAWGCTSPGRWCGATAARSASTIPRKGRARVFEVQLPGEKWRRKFGRVSRRTGQDEVASPVPPGKG